MMFSESSPQLTHQYVIAIPLNCRDASAIARWRKRNARTRWLPIDKDCASTAHPMLTPKMGASQTMVVAQKIGKVGPIRTALGSRQAVNVDPNYIHFENPI
jgi:hypothetical protein